VTQALQRAFGFKGKYTPLLDEVIVPVYVVQDPAPAVVTRLVGAFDDLSQGGGSEQQHVRLWNPVGSGVLGVLNFVRLQVTDEIEAVTTKPHIMRAKIVITDVEPTGAPSPGTFRDSRLGSQPSILEVRSDRDLITTPPPFFAEIVFMTGIVGAPTQSLDVESSDPRQPLVVLQPGSFLEITTRDSTTPTEPVIRTNWQWLEVPITEQFPPGGLPGT